MNTTSNDIQDLSDEELTFSHKFCLEKPYYLTCVGQTICDILGYSEEEIKEQFHNCYVPMVHPEDQARYLQYLEQLSSQEQTLALRYRMIKKSGEIVYINDISFSHKKQDGKLYGFSVIVDITDSIQYHSAYSMFNLSSSVPFAYLQCTCEKYPKVLCVNDQMLKYLNVTQESSDWTDFLHDNIFFMIPFEERDTFRKYLDAALMQSEPIKIRHNIIQSDRKQISVVGWLGTITNQQNEKEYSIVYTDMINQSQRVEKPTDNSYFRALESAYNIIFEINLSLNTVECIYGRETSDLGNLCDVRMTVDSAIPFWLDNYIVEDDRDHMRAYLQDIITPGAVANATNPLQSEFRIAWDNHVIYSFICVAISLNSSSILLCCRDTAKVQYSSLQAREIQAMKKLHQYFDDYLYHQKGVVGVAIFQTTDQEHCTLIHISKFLLDISHIRYDQCLHYMVEGFCISDIQNAASKSWVYDLIRLLKGETVHFTLPETMDSITLTCKSIADDTYEIIATTAASQSIAGVPNKGIFARTFGFFDLFVDGKPVIFSNNKEKELMALLIDRNGGTLTSSDAISYLWEGQTIDDRLRTKYRKLALGLKKTLQRYGIEDILINNGGVRSINTSALTCDYYELLAGNVQYVQSFHNSYMSDYTWGERTLGTLWDFS